MKDFEQILAETLAHWPVRVSFGIWRLPRGRTIVRGLTDFEEEVAEAFAGRSNEFVLHNMNWAIATAIHEYARSYPRHTLKLDLKNLSRSAIRAKFEADMQYCLGLPPDEQCASADELAMVTAYFANAGK